jgi:hypothetical protein
MRLLLLGVLPVAAATGSPTMSIEVHPPTECPDASDSTVFCSLADAASWVASTAQQRQHDDSRVAEICLHPGVHTVREPIQLDAKHSGSRWSTCVPSSAAPGSHRARAIISGGVALPTASWQRVKSHAGVWAARMPADVAVTYMRTVWVNGVRANRTVLNATALLGDLRPTSSGYLSQYPVPWQPTAEQVELNYFQQLAPWQAQRCVLTHAAGRSLTVAQPCFSSLQQRAAGVPGLPRNRSSGRTGCADHDPECGLVGNPLGSGLPMFIENVPITDPGLPKNSVVSGQFSFSPRQQKLYYRPRPGELSSDGRTFTAQLVVPVSEGLVAAVGLQDASFVEIDFEFMAWNSPSLPAGFVDLQDGITELGYIPGAVDCVNCSNITVSECALTKLGGSGVTINGVAQRINLTALDVRDVSGNGIAIGTKADACNLS